MPCYHNNCCGASEPDASERSSRLMYAERVFYTKFYLAHGIVVVRACYAQNITFKLAQFYVLLILIVDCLLFRFRQGHCARHCSELLPPRCINLTLGGINIYSSLFFGFFQMFFI